MYMSTKCAIHTTDLKSSKKHLRLIDVVFLFCFFLSIARPNDYCYYNELCMFLVLISVFRFFVALFFFLLASSTKHSLYEFLFQLLFAITINLYDFVCSFNEYNIFFLLFSVLFCFIFLHCFLKLYSLRILKENEAKKKNKNRLFSSPISFGDFSFSFILNHFVSIHFHLLSFCLYVFLFSHSHSIFVSTKKMLRISFYSYSLIVAHRSK